MKLLILVLGLFISCTACNSNSLNHDLQDSPDLHDSDELPEEDIDEWADYDYPAGKEGDPDCPSLYNAGFPYTDGNGRKHFCRKCDLPAPENDPQCIRNLWEMKNREIMKEWPDYYCYPLPCDVTQLFSEIWNVTAKNGQTSAFMMNICPIMTKSLMCRACFQSDNTLTI
jgi:hypothetical protein